MSEHEEIAAAEHNRFVIGLLGGGEPELPTEDIGEETPVDFDGGARESAPEPENPEQAHNELVAMIARLGSGAD